MSDHSISLTQAIDMTSLYRSEKENILEEQKRNSGILPICEIFAREAFDDLLAISGCEKMAGSSERCLPRCRQSRWIRLRPPFC